MPHLHPLFLFIPLLAAVSTMAPAAAAGGETTVYDVLKAHGLPMGLLPKGVVEFHVGKDGTFEVRLEKPCTAKFENELHYEANVSGVISYGQIGGLKGISAQELFLWFPVKGIRVDIPSSGIIYFDVGVIFKQFSLSLFETPPECHAASAAAAAAVRAGGLAEGVEIARVASQRTSGKLRYILDNGMPEKAKM